MLQWFTIGIFSKYTKNVNIGTYGFIQATLFTIFYDINKSCRIQDGPLYRGNAIRLKLQSKVESRRSAIPLHVLSTPDKE